MERANPCNNLFNWSGLINVCMKEFNFAIGYALSKVNDTLYNITVAMGVSTVCSIIHTEKDFTNIQVLFLTIGRLYMN